MAGEPRRRATKAELRDILLNKLNSWVEQGDTPEQAIERLTLRQYDFLVEQGVDLDNFILTPEQQKAAGEILKTQAGRKRGQYNKKYPQAKQDLYNGLVEYLTVQGAEIIPLERQNFRDLEFILAGTKYKIVLSNPRT